MNHLIITALENFPSSLLGRNVQLGHGLNGRAAQLRQVQTISDYADFADRVALFEPFQMGAVVAMPLVRQNRLVGTLSIVYQAPRQFSQEDLHTLDLFAALAAAALEQRRAMAEAQAREAEARSLSNRLTTAQEEEQAHIASLLHDSIGGQLTVIQKNSEALRNLLSDDEPAAAYLETNLELLQQTHQQVRHLAMDLNAKALADFGLAPAARQYIDRLCASTGLSIKLHITGQVRRLPAEVERIAFRGLQEALTNTLRHAHATEIAAQLHLGHCTLRLTVQDNGRGFDQTLPQQGTALGLPYLRRQVEGRGGEFLDETYLEQALLAGAQGYILKSDPNQLILTALRAVNAGEMFISPALADKWEQLQTRPTISTSLDSLSSRERQVLQLVASGQPNQRVATRLGISVRTVEVHRRNIMDKIGVKNIAQLIKFAVEHNLL